MKKTVAQLTCFIALMLIGIAGIAQANTKQIVKKENNTTMKTYLIEREIPNAGQLTQEELKGISQKSCSVLKEMGPKIQWVHSYVTGNKIYCIYRAESEEQIREHAQRGGFPANKIVEVNTMISPATAE